MSFGTGRFGTSPYGAAILSGGITLVTALPAPDDTGVPITEGVSFTVNAPAEYDELTLSLTFNGTQVIQNGEFLPGYSGSIVFDGPDLTVTVPTHPAFPDGNAILVEIDVVDLSSTLLSVSYTFNTGGATISPSETLVLSENLVIGLHAPVAETLTLTELLSPFVANASDTLTLSDAVSFHQDGILPIPVTLTLTETLQVGALFFETIGNTQLRVDFPEEMNLENVGDTDSYLFEAVDGGFVITISKADPITAVLQSGTQGQVVETHPGTFQSTVFDTVTGSFLASDIGRYLYVVGSPDTSISVGPKDPFRIVGVDGALLHLDRPLSTCDPANGTYVPGTGFTPGTGQLQWEFVTGARGAMLTVTESTAGRIYRGTVRGLKKITGVPFQGNRIFTATAIKPKLVSVEFLPEDGLVLVSFDEPMRIDDDLLSPDEYTITGPTQVAVRRVTAIDPSTIVLETAGFGPGSYQLTVNATGTPKDAAGNPIDPTFNEAVFTGSVPLTNRSIFTDKGPIVKPPLTVQSGTGGTVQTFTTTTFGPSKVFTSTEVVLPGASFTSAHVGLQIELTGTSVNGGTFPILAVLTPTRVRLQASFVLPDPNNGSIAWKLINPRTGEVADDPTDVTVRVNGVVTSVQAVIGLLGQIVLPSAPAPSDDVKVDYHWVINPTVEFRRLNSKEFRLNNWANDAGHTSTSQHSYRYRNVTVQPGTFDPEDLRADLVQPLLRELHYHAFERAYSVALNDPNLLVLNTPIHRIAYPPLSREIESKSVIYAADVLPENDPTPWVRKGIGSAAIVSGNLVVQDNTGGPFPTGNPLFWTQGVDLTFPHVFAATWRMQINSATPVGVYTGVSVGWSNESKAVVLGYLDDGGTRKIGILKKGFGNDPSNLSAWAGGLSSSGDPTGLPAAFNWSTLHSYRFFRGQDGVVRLFVDGEIIETLRLLEDELPFLEELNDPFDQVQGVYFGSLSREAQNISTWDFVRYLVLPTNPEQTAPSIFASYEGDILPEDSITPWTPIGYHGNESISSGSLILDSTSATTAATSEAVGLIGGDFRGFTRIEPLLLVSSDVVLDFNVQLRTFTHGITPNAVMAAVDDGSRLIQVSFLPTVPQPKVSYPGRTFPQDATPKPWSALGTASSEMMGRTLRIMDATIANGLVYFVEDLAPMGSPDRIIETSLDFFAEFKLQALTFQNDGTPAGFCGATMDVFDGTRSMGLMLRQNNSGTLQVAFHSDGSVLSTINFNWNDAQPHIYRLVKSTTGNLVSLFIDNTLMGSLAYSAFTSSFGNPTISFGSSTASSVGARSVMDWFYVNVWRGQPTSGTNHYVGIWKGTDGDSLTGYYLPTKVTGKANVAGNALTDSAVDFVVAGVVVGDPVIIDVDANKGVYEVASVTSTTLTVVGTFPSGPTEVSYRIPSEVDFTVPHKFRVLRDPGGTVALYLDSISAPIIRLDYSEVVLPPSFVGLPALISRGLPSVTWGSFDPTNLSQTAWDFVRYGITRAPSEIRIVPHHQFLNQRNVMASPEHLFTSVIHGHTQFSSASTGIPYPWADFVANPAAIAFTKLNEGTPLVPSTQTYEVRRPVPVFEFISGLNRPEDVLGDPDFLTNDGTQRAQLVVPNDVLYNCLEVTEQTTGEPEHIAPFSDENNPIALKRLNWTKEVCGKYEGNVLPENDPGFGTPWVLESDDPGAVSTTVFAGVLSYAVGADTGNTIYRNLTPLTDPVGLQTRVDFNLKIVNDSTAGTGDTGIRCGFNALGMTAALAFVTTPVGDREVQLLDLNSGEILGAIPFDFLDGAFHVYRLEKNVAEGTLDFLIDP